MSAGNVSTFISIKLTKGQPKSGFVALLRSRIRSGPPGPVQAFVDRGVDFVSANSLRELVTGMNELPDVVPLDYATVEADGIKDDDILTIPDNVGGCFSALLGPRKAAN